MIAQSMQFRAHRTQKLTTALSSHLPSHFTLTSRRAWAGKQAALPLPPLRAQDEQQASQTDTPSPLDSVDEVPAGCMRYSVTLGKPLGLVLEENKAAKTIVVAEIQEGGNAEKVGGIGVGDILIATTGYTRTTEQMYGEIAVRGGEQIVRVSTRNESFDTILAAISSHPASIQVTLEFQRC